MTIVRLGNIINGKFEELKHKTYSPVKFNDWEIDGETLTATNSSSIVFGPTTESWGTIGAVMIESGMLSKELQLDNPATIISSDTEQYVKFAPGDIEIQVQ